MDPGPGEQGQPRGEDERDAGMARERAQQERYGPVGLERYTKDDGRALVLYARAEDDRE